MLDMFHMVGLHKFYSILIILMLVNNISLGNHAHLSSWCLRYGLMIWSSLQMFDCLGFFFENWKPLAKLPVDMPKSYQSHMMSYLENLRLICCLLLHWALSNCCDPCENSFHAFMIKIHVHSISPCYASTLGVSIVSSIHSIKIKLHV